MSNENETPKPADQIPSPSAARPENGRYLLQRSDDEDPRATEARLDRSNQRTLRESRSSRPHD